MVFLMSFVQDGTWTTQLFPPAYTTENYSRLFRDPQFFEPIRNSLWMAAVATGANLVWGLIATFWLRKQKGVGRKLADALIILPWALPGMVVALAMLETFSSLSARTGTTILAGNGRPVASGLLHQKRTHRVPRDRCEFFSDGSISRRGVRHAWRR